MTAPQPTAAPPAPRAARRAWLPPQHGTWVMLALPFLVGVVLGGLSWLHVPLALAWFTGYVASYYLMTAFKSGRWRRVLPQLLAFGVPALVTGLLVAVARPYLLLVIPVTLIVLGINALVTRHHGERTLVNDFSLVLLATLMVPISASVNQESDAALTVLGTRSVIVAALLVLGYLGGAVLALQAMFAEPARRGIRAVSLTWHVLWVGLVLAVEPWAAPLCALLTGRAWWYARHRVAGLHRGLIAAACSAGVLFVVWLLLPGLTSI